MFDKINNLTAQTLRVKKFKSWIFNNINFFDNIILMFELVGYLKYNLKNYILYFLMTTKLRFFSFIQ